MPTEPAYYPLLRILIGLVCGLLGLAAMVLVGAFVDTPARAVSDYAASYGAAGSLALGFGVIGGGLALTRWSQRRDECRRIAETGLMEHRHRPFSQGGWTRNLAILLAPLAVLVAIGLAMWLTGTPLPRAILR